MGWSYENIKKGRREYTKRFRNFFILDIETVIDEDMFQEVADDKEKESLSNGDFLPLPFHRVVAVSFMIIKNKKIEEFRSYCSKNEAQLLNNFWNGFKKAHSIEERENRRVLSVFPVLISINGKYFDLPVLKLRSLKHIHLIKDRFFISVYFDRFDKWEKEYPQYTNKYTLFHIDIPADIFGKKVSLKKLCYLCGIPVKQEGDGASVDGFFKHGDFEKIAKYCGEDVKATAMLFSYINKYLLFDMYDFPDIQEIGEIQPEIFIRE